MKDKKIILTESSIFHPETTKQICFTTPPSKYQTFFSPYLLHTGKSASLAELDKDSWSPDSQSSRESHKEIVPSMLKLKN